MTPALDLRLYLVVGAGDCAGRPLDWVVGEAVAGGVTSVQLREKQAETGDFAALGRRVKALLDPLGVALVINDDLEAALACDAAALHVGQEDLPPAEARARLPRPSRLGLSITADEDLPSARAGFADHVGIGPVFSTATKPDAAPALGLAGLARLRAALPDLPAVAIGGIDRTNAGAAMATGVDGLAVVSAIAGAQSPRLAAATLRKIIESVLTEREGKR
ncbi:MAG: thiamine phosphate synthase [Rhodospirillales bacterium]